jgi:hypothetical protein
MDLNIVLMVTLEDRLVLIRIGDGPLTDPVDLNAEPKVRISDFREIDLNTPQQLNMFREALTYTRGTSVPGRGIRLPPGKSLTDRLRDPKIGQRLQADLDGLDLMNITLMVTLENRLVLIRIGDGPCTDPVDLNANPRVKIIVLMPRQFNVFRDVVTVTRGTSGRGRGIRLPPNTGLANRPVRKNSRGRPIGSRAIPQEAFQHSYLASYRTVQLNKGAPPTQLEVAMELGISERTLRTYLDKYNAPWPPT